VTIATGPVERGTPILCMGDNNHQKGKRLTLPRPQDQSPPPCPGAGRPPSSDHSHMPRGERYSHTMIITMRKERKISDRVPKINPSSPVKEQRGHCVVTMVRGTKERGSPILDDNHEETHSTTHPISGIYRLSRVKEASDLLKVTIIGSVKDGPMGPSRTAHGEKKVYLVFSPSSRPYFLITGRTLCATKRSG
jgi:hypothetical protein